MGIAALLGWSGFAYSTMSARTQVSSLTGERDASRAAHAKLREAGGELAEVEAKLGAARTNYDKVAQGLAEARAKSGAAQQELASLTKRLDQAKDRVSQTGSIRPAEPPRKPAQKP